MLKGKKADIALLRGTHLRATGRHLHIHSVTCHPTQVNAPRLTQPRRLVLNLPTPEGWKAELI